MVTNIFRWAFDFIWYIGEALAFVIEHITIIGPVIIGIVILVLGLMIARSMRLNGIGLSHRGDPRGSIRWKGCTSCDGCGVTMLDGRPIPKELRTFGKGPDGGYVNGPIANTKSCNECRGTAGFWVAADGTKTNHILER